jgi:hypothetical protein
MTKDKGDVVFSTKVGDPIPAKDTFHTDNDVIEVWKDHLEKWFRIGFDVLMHFGFTSLIENADIHFSRMKVDTAVVLVLLLIKSHVLASFG